MSYQETETCQNCGAVLETEYEIDAWLCSECLHNEDDEDDLGDCPHCGCSLNPNEPESCFCTYPDESHDALR